NQRLTLLCTSLFPLSFLFNNTSPTYLYTLSLHDALPILLLLAVLSACRHVQDKDGGRIVGNEPIFQNFEYVGKDEIYVENPLPEDRKSTRLNSSHVKISYAVFCLKKKKNNRTK